MPTGVTSGLPGLHPRLAGGIQPAVTRLRPHDRGTRDDRAIRESRSWRHLVPLDAHLTRRGAEPMRATEVDAALDAAAHDLVTERDTLLAVLLAQQDLLGHLQETITTNSGTPTASRLWFWACWTAEAAWRAAHRVSRETADTTPAGFTEESTLLLPVAARLRFLTLSEAFRINGSKDGLWHPGDNRTRARIGALYGTDSRHLITVRCREARTEWQRHLGEHDSHPLAAAALPHELEQEIDMLLFRHAGEPGWPARRDQSTWHPLVSSWAVGDDPDTPPTADDTAVIVDAIDVHLLPRMRLRRVVRATDPLDAPAEHHHPVSSHARNRRRRRWAGIAPTFAALGSAILAATGNFTAAAVTAAGAYATLTGLVVVLGRNWATRWLLRMPASSTIGMLALITLHPDWWTTTTNTATAAAVLATAAIGYLVVEARNHGVAAADSIRRALGIAAAGAVHAFLVTAVGFILVAPAFTEQGSELATNWNTWTVGQGLARLVPATAWCLAAGVFSQILWDDQPITAALAHLRRRRPR